MVADREYEQMVEEVLSRGGSFYAAAMNAPHVFSWYFTAHIRAISEEEGVDVYPYAYGTEGAFLNMAAGLYGWWHDPETSTTYTASGTDTNKGIVFGMNAERLDVIYAQALADGVDVVRCVRLDTNEVV